MNNIYAITMPSREKRLREHLAERGCLARFFPAFDGQKLGLSTTKPYMRDRGPGEEPFFIGPGCNALVLSALAIIKIALADDLTHVTILEDDIVLDENWKERMQSHLLAMEPDWLVYHGVPCCSHTVRRFRPEIGLTKAKCLCMPWVTYSRRAMEMINEKATLGIPYDVLIQDIFECHPEQWYVADPPLGIQLSANGIIPTTLS